MLMPIIYIHKANWRTYVRSFFIKQSLRVLFAAIFSKMNVRLEKQWNSFLLVFSQNYFTVKNSPLIYT